MKITCDQVDWLIHSLNRYIDTDEKPSISRKGKMQLYACLYEIIEILGLEFEDEAARLNATPPDVVKHVLDNIQLAGNELIRKATNQPHSENDD